MNIYKLILAALRTEFQGVEIATLQWIASKKSEGVTSESKVNSTVEGVSFQDVLNSYGDYQADGAQKTAISNYEKKHNIKDDKSIEETKPQTPAPTPLPKLTEKVSAWAQSLIDFNKTLSERSAAMDAKTKTDIRDQQIDEVAKSFGIPEFAYKGEQIADDADLNQYFIDSKQEIQNSGFQFVKSPEEGNHEHQSEVNSIAEQIEKGTKEIVELNSK